LIVEEPRVVALPSRLSRHRQRAQAPHRQAAFTALIVVAVVGIVATCFAAVAAFGSRGSGAEAAGRPEQAGVLALGAEAAVVDVGEVGETFAYANGVSVTVRGLRRARASGSAVGARPGQLLAVAEIEVVNNSRGTLGLDEMQVGARVGTRAGDHEHQADEVVDPGRVPPRLAGSLKPGRHATGSYAFALQAAAEARDLAIELAPGYAYRWATFEGAAR
jgi:hypothetical protein